MIDSFSGYYRFLSNFWLSDVVYDGFVYRNSEAAYQAAKTLDPIKKSWFVPLDPGPAKRLGKNISLRPDWDEVKDQIMYDICKAKFTQNPVLGRLLIETGDEELIEGNTWGDRYWGRVDGVGRNQLGITLMRIRSEISGKI
jgi:ribA/ribD-fused uncharacterized protein